MSVFNSDGQSEDLLCRKSSCSQIYNKTPILRGPSCMLDIFLYYFMLHYSKIYTVPHGYFIVFDELTKGIKNKLTSKKKSMRNLGSSW